MNEAPGRQSLWEKVQGKASYAALPRHLPSASQPRTFYHLLLQYSQLGYHPRQVASSHRKNWNKTNIKQQRHGQKATVYITDRGKSVSRYGIVCMIGRKKAYNAKFPWEVIRSKQESVAATRCRRTNYTTGACGNHTVKKRKENGLQNAKKLMS